MMHADIFGTMPAIDPKVFPILTTPRLVLRKPGQKDVEQMYSIRSDERVMRPIGRTVANSLDDARELLDRMDTLWNEGNAIAWAITLKDDDDRLIGTIGFHRLIKEHFRAEIGYVLHPDHWRNGIMGEAMGSVVAHGFSEMGLHSIEANTDPANTASNALLKKHGFQQEGLLKENFYRDGRFFDTAIWGRIKGTAMDQHA